MIARLIKPLMMITDPLLYFFAVHVMTLYLFRRGIGRLFAFDTFFALIVGVVLLAAITYHGAWGSIAERQRDRFLKCFILFDLCPGILGATVAAVRFIQS